LPILFERETGYVQLNSLSASWMISRKASRDGRAEDAQRVFRRRRERVHADRTLPVMLIAAWPSGMRRPAHTLPAERVGESGRIFEILKFRSMRVEAEQDGIPRWRERTTIASRT